MANQFSTRNFETKWAEIIEKAWTDESFKKELLAHPVKVLQKYGISFEGAEVTIYENTPKKIHLILPTIPQEEMSEAELKTIAAGAAQIQKQGFQRTI